MRLLGGPLHGHQQVFGYWPKGYAFEPGEDGVYRFVHSTSLPSALPLIGSIREG